MFRRSFITAVLGAVVFVGLTAGASAHVTVNPREATKGGFAKLSFRIPTESDTSSTVKVEVQFPDPTEAPLASASVQPHDGWSYEVERVTLDTPVKVHDGEITEVVRTITWTADTSADGIKPGQFDEFSISVGPLPEHADVLTFKAVQTYSNGTEVGWIETGEDAEHPAPVLTLLAADADDDLHVSYDGGDRDSNGLAVAALILAALGLLTGAAAFVRAGRH